MEHLTNLLLAAQRGDRWAFERFVAETQPDVWRLCRHLGDPDDADDLTQETYERVVASLHRYRSEGAARSWLLTIARRVCADHVRRRQRQRRRQRSLEAQHAAGSGGLESHEPDVSGSVDLDVLLRGLDHDRRAAFVLTQVLGLYYDEAADVLDCPIGTIRSRVARARRDLATQAAAPDQRATGTDGRSGAT